MLLSTLQPYCSMPINKEKYQEVILYLCQKLGGEIKGKKKLAKLLYFADFDFYEINQKSITGDVYRAFPKGPLPSALDEIVRGLTEKKALAVSSVKEWGDQYAPTEIYKCLIKPDISVFNSDEIKILDRTVKRYGGLNGEQLAVLSHEAPYTSAEPYQEIPYEFAYYRGTDFSDL